MLNFIQEHLPAIAGIIIALLIISVGFIMWNKMSDGLDSAGEQLENMNNRIATEAYANLDGRTDISGSTVIGFVSDHQNDATWIQIVNKSGETINVNTTDGSTYSKGTHSVPALTGNPTANQVVGAMKNKSNTGKGYINPAWNYSATVTYDGGAIAGIKFEKK